MGNKFNLDKLQFEDSSDELKNENAPSDEEAIEFSIKIIDALGSKMRSHNKDFKNKTNLKELKEVYSRGAGDCSHAKNTEESCGHWALARVNMFLRMKQDGCLPKDVSLSTDAHSPDISDNWAPSQEDFDKAEKEIKELGLDYVFSSIDELYIENYKNVDWEW